MFPLGCCFLVPALNRLQNIAWLRDARPVNLGLRLALHLVSTRGRTSPPTLKVDANAFRFVFLKRTGVGLLLRNAYFRQNVQN
jgi:hypothetical protein